MKIDEKSLSIALSKSSVTDWRRANGPALQCKSLILSHAGPIKINISVLSISLVRFRYCKWMGSMDTPEISPTLDHWQEECIVSIRSHLAKSLWWKPPEPRSIFEESPCTLSTVQGRKIYEWYWMIILKHHKDTIYIDLYRLTWANDQDPNCPNDPQMFLLATCRRGSRRRSVAKRNATKHGRRRILVPGPHSCPFQHVPSTLICSEHPPCPPVFPGCHVQRQAGLRRGLLSKELKALSPKQREKAYANACAVQKPAECWPT